MDTDKFKEFGIHSILLTYTTPTLAYQNNKETLHLNENEELCSMCKGTGYISIITEITANWYTIKACNYCRGRGKLDWLDKLRI